MKLENLKFEPAALEDEHALQEIRAAAFGPIFESFRRMMGESVYELVQKKDDELQGTLLRQLLGNEGGWMVYKVLLSGETVGFVSVKCDRESFVGEIGLNAVAPGSAGHGIGTSMYEFALEIMREAGMKAAVVSTGGDLSHLPARRAYEKAGFHISIPSVWMCRKI